MILKLIKSWGAVILIWGVAYITPALSGVDPDKRGPSTFPLQDPQDKTDRSELKCWQHGRLIIDERNWSPDRTSGSGTLLRAGDGDFNNMWLSNFGNDTFCTLKAKDNNR